MLVIERISEIIHTLKITQTEFCQKTGVADSTISSTRKRKGGVGEDVLVAILEGYPNLNARWLLLGEGEMWLGQAPITKKIESPNVELEKEVLVLRERVSGLEQVLASKEQEIGAKDKIIKLLEGK